jgi:EAL domain-containing protein (putative c-di-GMP-specific phosphodiesterase class I)
MKSIAITCQACKEGIDQPFPFSMAFQPIVDVANPGIFAYEALVRGPNGESARSVLGQVTPVNRYAFDQCCRIGAIELALRLGLASTGAMLSINFMPGAVYSPATCIGHSLEAAKRFGFPSDRLIFEITETERVRDDGHLLGIVAEYRRRGLHVALDDLGAGYSGLNLLADLPVDIVKLDMKLTRNLPDRPAARAIVEAMARLSENLGFALVAEGVETVEEFNELRACGIHLMQGYLLAKPAFEALPSALLPARDGFIQIDPGVSPLKATA